MKIKFSICVKILILLAIIAYGFYVYWINTDHTKKTKVGNLPEIETTSSNSIHLLPLYSETESGVLKTTNILSYDIGKDSNPNVLLTKNVKISNNSNQKASRYPVIRTRYLTVGSISENVKDKNDTLSSYVKPSATITGDNSNNDTNTENTTSEEATEGLTDDNIADYIDNSDVLSEIDEDESTKAETFYNESNTDTNTNNNNPTETNQENNTNKSISDYFVEKLNLHATSALLMDASNNRVLYEKNGYKEMPMASTTKIMTLIVALENANMNDTVTVSKYAASMPDVQLGIRAGEKYKLGDLVYSLMLESHNDVAVAIAEHVGGSVEGFAKMMNTKAKELGCDHTNFVTPNGLDADYHYTTAEDLAKIGSYAIKNKEFIGITNTASHSFRELTNGRTFTVTNKDRFLYLMDGAIGIKTGFTNKAGYCFVGALEKDGKKFVSVVLACGWPPNKSYKWQDTKLLMKYGLDHFVLKNISGDTKTIDPIKVVDGQEDKVSVAYKRSEVELLLNEKETSRIEYSIPETLTAPVHKNEVVGYITYYVDEQVYKQIPVFTTKSVKKIDLKYCIEKVLSLWLFE